MYIEPLVRLITSSDFPDLAVDDQELLIELRSRDIPVEAAVWDDPEIDWSTSPLCILRSVYDYHLHRAEFLAWVDHVSRTTKLLNDPKTIRWNSHKSYLNDLKAADVQVIETVWLQQGEHVDVSRICRDRGWEKAVVKPAVSASAYRTLPFTADDAAAAQAHADGLVNCGDAMVQPYLDEIETTGESSIIYLGGKRTHAARRPSGLHSAIEVARMGVPLIPTAEETKFARAVFELLTPVPLYARVDIVTTSEWGMLLLELELIEPALYLRHSPAPVIIFADAIEREFRASV